MGQSMMISNHALSKGATQLNCMTEAHLLKSNLINSQRKKPKGLEISKLAYPQQHIVRTVENIQRFKSWLVPTEKSSQR